MKRVTVKSSVEDFDNVSKEYSDAVNRQQEQQKVYDRQRKQYLIRLKASKDIVAENIKNLIEDATDSDFMRFVEVYVSIYPDYGNIKVSYGESNKFDDDVPLVWNWTFELGGYGQDDRVDRTTSSWSGLNATTAQNVDTLKKSVSALEALANVNDEYLVSLIKSNTVRPSDYVTQEVDKVDANRYLMRKLEALAGTDRYVLTFDGPYYQDYYRIVKDTGKQFAVESVRITKPKREYDWRIDDYVDRDAKVYDLETKRYNKEKFADMVVEPVKPVTMDDIEALMHDWDEEYRKSQEEDS